MKFKYTLLLSCLLLGSNLIYSQHITGLWLVEKVQVGEEQMTPVAKWFDIRDDGQCNSGNGWLQNMTGIWNFDKDTSEFSATNKFGIKDEAGPFKVEFSGESMLWSRTEEGMDVRVHLTRITTVPPSYTDLLSGLWKLSTEQDKALEEHQGILDNTDHLFIRWDRIYRATLRDNKNETGYWHVNAHRPELTLLPHQAEASAETWKIDVNENTMELTGNSDSNKGQVLKFKRIHEFPR